MLKLNFAIRSPLVIDFSPPLPRCYVREGTHTYLWLRDKGLMGLFLTMESGSIEVIKARLEQGVYRVNGMKEEKLVPIQYDLLQAVRIYHESTLAKSAAAQREIANLLGMDTKHIQDDPAPAPVEKKPTEPKSAGTVISLSDLCAELGIEPSVARKKLRGKVEKPGGRWEWANQGDVDVVRGFLV